MTSIKTLFNSKTGRILVSVLLGLGVAALFRTMCKEGKCIIINGPPLNEIEGYYYKMNDTCYKYTPVASECKES